MQTNDNRFDKLLESLEEFDAKMDKLRRVKNFLLDAIWKAWKSSAQINLVHHVDLAVRLPIGDVNMMMQVEVSFDQTKVSAHQVRGGAPEWFRMRLLDQDGNEIREGEITLVGLRFVMLNPNPMIDAAAKFSQGLGCLELFKGKVGRFCWTQYKF